jgi:acetyl-CoA carboxylase carboxyl transferase subunit alpha
LANLNVLDFEKSIAELDENLAQLHRIAADRANPQNKPELPDRIAELERHRTEILRELFAHLSPWDQVLLARHKDRPYTLDYVSALLEDWQELHGDRMGYDDGAIVAGLARFEGQAIAVIGQQKGRDLKQRQHRNFGYARPEGYRKAGRILKLAARFGLPVLTFVDTAGAAADVSADERGISEAIARNMFDMAVAPVPIIAVIIGEGGSGGALGIAVGDRVLMLEHAIYSVIAPEGCAAILWRDPAKNAEAAKALNLTADGAKEFGLIDAIVPEPLGGAHRDWSAAADLLRTALRPHLSALASVSPETLVADRYEKFRRMGRWLEVAPDPVDGDGEVEAA